MDFKTLMEQASAMQKQVDEVQNAIANQEFEGKAGGNLVIITTTGSGHMSRIKIDPSLMVDSEREVLEDLIVTAYNDAKKKSDESSQQRIKNVFGASGFKLPF